MSFDNFIKKISVDETVNFKEQTCLIFGLKEKIGALADALKIFEVKILRSFFRQVSFSDQFFLVLNVFRK